MWAPGMPRSQTLPGPPSANPLIDRAPTPAYRQDVSRSPADEFKASDVALVHDYLLVMRGAERTFASIADMWPSAPVYTLVYDAVATEQRFAQHPVCTSMLQRTGISQAAFRTLLPLYPTAMARLPVRDHRIVISSSSAFALGARVSEGAFHLCYCHSPFRYAWFEQRRALAEIPVALRPILAITLSAIRRWDLAAAARVSHFVANSRLTQQRIRQIYGRPARVVHPPVEVDRFYGGEAEDYFLVVGELVSHKGVEIAAQAAEVAGCRLKVVGGGPESARLEAQYGNRIEFVGRVGDDELERLYASALAVVVPGIEEFGIVAVEAQAAGKPVLAARGGGALETVVEGVTGHFVEPGDLSSLTRAMRDFRTGDYDSGVIREHALRFSLAAFQAKIYEELAESLNSARAD